MDPLQRFFLGCRLFQLFGRILHHMDIAARTGRHRTQEIARGDGIGISAADTSGPRFGDPAGTIGAQPAAYTLRSVAALILLRDHPVVGHFHRQPFQIGFQWLVRTGAHVSLIHFPSTPFYFVLPPHACFRGLPSPNTPKGDKKAQKLFENFWASMPFERPIYAVAYQLLF